MVFTWTDQDIETTFSVTGEDIETALTDATELWPTLSMEYTTL